MAARTVDGVDPAVRAVLALNIRHYDEKQRAIVAKLLAEEETRLARLLAGGASRRQ